MEKTTLIQKTDVIEALESGCRVYFTERNSTEVYEFTEKDSLTDLRNADFFIAVKKG